MRIHSVLKGVALALTLCTAPALAAPATALQASTYMTTGVRLIAKGDNATGIRFIAAWVAGHPSDIYAQTYLVTLIDQGRFNWDVPLHEDLARILPGYPPVLKRLGTLYEGKGRYAEAEALYLRWADLRAGNAEPYAQLAELYTFTGQHERALLMFERHRDVVGESDYALRRMAAVYREMGNPQAADSMLAVARGVPAALPHRTELTQLESPALGTSR